MFYETLTGERPFRRATPSAIKTLVPGRSPIPISALRRDLPSSLVRLVQNALQGDREFRCQGAAEVRADLKRIQRALEPDEHR